MAVRDAHGVLPWRHAQLPRADRTTQVIVGGPLVVLDLDHPYPQVLHGPKPYTERYRKLHSVTCVSAAGFYASRGNRIRGAR